MENKNIFEDLKEYMFTNETMERFNKKNPLHNEKPTLLENEKKKKNTNNNPSPATLPITTIIQKEPQVKQDFMPFQKDKLFWCFYIILFGYEEYELNKNNAFIVEKKIKINAIEKLRQSGSAKLGPKQLAEMEDELCNQPILTIKGLNALCICHNVSIFYVDQRKYYDLNILGEKKGIIMNRSLKYDLDEAFVRENYLHIENINKPIKAISGYTIKELQAICKKLDIIITDATGKNKLKNVLYQDILAVI